MGRYGVTLVMFSLPHRFHSHDKHLYIYILIPDKDGSVSALTGNDMTKAPDATVVKSDSDIKADGESSVEIKTTVPLAMPFTMAGVFGRFKIPGCVFLYITNP